MTAQERAKLAQEQAVHLLLFILPLLLGFAVLGKCFSKFGYFKRHWITRHTAKSAPTAEELTDAIRRLGCGIGSESISDVRAAVWQKLLELGIVERRPDNSPKLTFKGETAFIAIEDGKDVPEFTDRSHR
jgi:hypothetical protein